MATLYEYGHEKQVQAQHLRIRHEFPPGRKDRAQAGLSLGHTRQPPFHRMKFLYRVLS